MGESKHEDTPRAVEDIPRMFLVDSLVSETRG
jgi:hypothetical protein